MSSNKSNLEANLKKVLPDIITKIKQEEDSSLREEFSSLLFPYIIDILRKYKYVIEPADTIESTAGWIILKILNNLEKIDLSKSVVGYITTTTNNYCIDLIRKSKMQKYYLKDDYIHYKKNSLASSLENSPEFFIDSNFLSNESEIIKLFFLEKKNYKEIRDLTGYTIADISKIIEDIKEITYNEQNFSV